MKNLRSTEQAEGGVTETRYADDGSFSNAVATVADSRLGKPADQRSFLEIKAAPEITNAATASTTVTLGKNKSETMHASTTTTSNQRSHVGLATISSSPPALQPRSIATASPARGRQQSAIPNGARLRSENGRRVGPV